MKLLNDFLGMLGYSFALRAFLVGMLVSLCSSLLGAVLVQKRYSMIGDGLSHVGFGALSIALALNLAPLSVSVPLVILAAFVLLKISNRSNIKADSAIALISTGSVAAGVIATSLAGGVNTDVYNFMFGSILAMSNADLYISVALSVCVLILFVMFYNKIFAVTFDESFAKASGVSVSALNMLIALLSALTIVVGMRIMGTMLISSLIIFPALTSMQVFKSFKGVVVSSAVLSVVCCFFGICASFLMSLPTGASIVAVNIIAFLLFFAIGKILKKQ